MTDEHTQQPGSEQTAEQLRETMRQQVRQILEDGRDVRRRIGAIMSDTAKKVRLDRLKLSSMTASILDESAKIINRTVPDKPDSVLREVVDGLGDGLSKAALAVKLSIQEAAQRGQQFAEEDLKRTEEDFEAVEEAFVESVRQAAERMEKAAATTADDVLTHASNTFAAISADMVAIRAIGQAKRKSGRNPRPHMP